MNRIPVSRILGLTILLGATIIAHFNFRYRTIQLDPALCTQMDTAPSIQENTNDDVVWMIVYVHGIMSIKPHIFSGDGFWDNNLARFMHDDVQNTIYSKTVELMRNNPHFYCNQAMQGHGLQEIMLDRVEPGYASGALANIHEIIYNELKLRKPTENHYYTYGWSGLLSDKARKREAVEFYRSLSQEAKRLQALGKTPRIRLISYSHGGNFCLNLAYAKPSVKDASPLTIDELVLIGVPIQKETDYLSSDPIFRRIYNIYSRGDRIQKLDFFSFDRFFSNRIFKDRDGFKVPKNKIVQIQLRMTRNNKFNKTKKYNVSQFDVNNAAILSGKHKLFRDSSPGHAELWFFGWTPQNYRENFTLTPLPAVAVLPLILDAVHQFDDQELFDTPTLVDIRPEHEILMVKNQKSKRSVVIGEFIPQEKLQELKDLSMKFHPPYAYTNALYEQNIQDALAMARRLHAEEYINTLATKAVDRNVKK